MFRTKSESFISDTVIDESILRPYIPPPKTDITEFGRNILHQFQKLKGLVNKLQQTTEKAILFQQTIPRSSAAPTSSVVSTFTTSLSPPHCSTPITSVVYTPPIITTTQRTTFVLPLPSTTSSSSTQTSTMVARYAPLNLPAQLNPLPQNFGQRLPQYDGICELTTRQHADKVINFIDLGEVDHEDVKMRLLAHSFSGEVKKWFRGVKAGTFVTFQELEDAFIARWGEKKNPLQILAKYDNLKMLKNLGQISVV